MGHASKPRSSKISFGTRELDRPGQLEAVAAGQLGGGRHPADEVVLLEAQDPHTAPGHDGRGREAVVAGTDDDGVVVRHRRDRSRSSRRRAGGRGPRGRTTGTVR